MLTNNSVRHVDMIHDVDDDIYMLSGYTRICINMLIKYEYQSSCGRTDLPYVLVVIDVGLLNNYDDKTIDDGS